MKKTRGGFTLIELLIVIAIIGILASVVLVSLNSARTKANVAAMKSTISSVSTGLVMCCGEETRTWGASAAGTDICAEIAGTAYPASNFVDYGTTGDPDDTVCDSSATVAVRVQNTGDTDCDGSDVTCSLSGCEYPAGC